MTQRRAKAGGEIGVNGFHYTGGEFLPTTDLAPMVKAQKAQSGVRKQQIAPYVYEVAPVAGNRSIYMQLAGIYGKVVSGKMVLNINQATLEHYNHDRFEIEHLAEQYNNGKRWI